ncbi:uncharacterized protein LOC126739858 [Anthonomus grandis grandis]|uniref:uncharacterized protein LOC126739858 n=1 Tax=Anthonomus grandis grandis TaxID=2921223 RepID=UPI0021665BCA|nr:uncharacterized protein LOC126739858 [Anthonomus grandis grandis]
MAPKHEEPCEIAHCSRFMDSLVTFLNEAGICMYQVKTCFGLTPGCTAAVKMNDEEKVEKLNSILSTLKTKCTDELNKSHQGGRCAPTCSTSINAQNTSSANPSFAQSPSSHASNFGGLSTIEGPSGSPSGFGGLSSIQASRPPPSVPPLPTSGYLRGNMPQTPSVQNSVNRRPMTPMSPPQAPSSPGLNQSNVSAPPAQGKNVLNVDTESCADAEGNCPSATPKKANNPPSGEPQVPVQRPNQECDQTCYGVEHSGISNVSPIRPTNATVRSHGRPSPNQSAHQSAFGYASRLAQPPSMSERFTSGYHSFQASNASGRSATPQARFNQEYSDDYEDDDCDCPESSAAPNPPRRFPELPTFHESWSNGNYSGYPSLGFRIPAVNDPRTPPGGIGPAIIGPEWGSFFDSTRNSSKMTPIPSYLTCPPVCDDTFMNSIMASRASPGMNRSAVPRSRPAPRPPSRAGGCGVGCRPIQPR